MEITTREECLNALSAIIVFLDKKYLFGISDHVFDIINDLRYEWKMED